MFRAIMLLIKITIILLVLSAIAAICVVTFVDPNQYKPEISALLEKSTKRKVNIYGNLQWSLTPHVSLNVRNLSLGNLQGFDGPLLTINEANVQISPVDLIQGKVVINGLDIQGITIKVIVDENGTSNIDDISKNIKIQDTSANNRETIFVSPKTVLFKSIKVNKAKIIYENSQTDSNWVANMNASTKDMGIRKYMKSLSPKSQNKLS